MKTITQEKIAKILNRSQSFVSKRLTKNSLRGFEIKLLSKALEVPAVAFIDSQEQIKYFGKSFINSNENDTTKDNHKSNTNPNEKVA